MGCLPDGCLNQIQEMSECSFMLSCRWWYCTVEFKKSILGACIEEKYLWTGYTSTGRQFSWLLFFFQNWNNCFLIVLTVLLFQWVQAAAALIASNLAETMCAIGYERNTRPWRARRLNHVFFVFFTSLYHIFLWLKGAKVNCSIWSVSQHRRDIIKCVAHV